MKKQITITIILAVTVVLIIGKIYEVKIQNLEDKLEGLEGEVITVSENTTTILKHMEDEKERYSTLESDIQLIKDSSEEKTKENEQLAMNMEQIENELLEMKYDAMMEDLSNYWHKTWERVYMYGGNVSDGEIENINFMLRSVMFKSNGWTEVNPLSCFFTSYYEDVKDIDLSEFLRQCPNGETPEELPEFEELKGHKSWGFDKAKTLYDIPVPVHRYKKEVIQDLFAAYAGVSLDSLSGVGQESLIYLDSTDAYYNFTSDFGPGGFSCIGGRVEDDLIKLKGKSSELTIVKVDGKYVIKSHLLNE